MASTDLRFDVQALDRASQAFTRIGQAVERFERRLDRLDGKTVSTEVEVKTEKAERQIGKFAADARRDIEKALKALPEIELDADATPAQREVARLRGELAELADKRIGVDIDAVDAIGRAKAIREQLQEIERRSPYNAQVATDTAAASAALAAFVGEVEAVDGKKATVKVDVDKSLSDTLIKVAQLGRALSTLALPAAAIAAAPQLASLGAAAVTASGSLLLLPAAGVAAGAAIATLVLGFKNFGDAVSDDPKKAAEALAKLAPPARDAAKAVSEIAPAWSQVQQAVQGALFDKLGDSLRQLSSNYLPVVRTNLVGIADGFNDAARSTFAFVNSKTGVQQMSGALTSSQQASRNLAAALEPVTEALFDVVETGASRLPQLTSGLGNASLKLAQFVDEARRSGDLGRWIDNGVDALKTLGSIAGNVGGSLVAIFDASKAAGADFLSTLDNLTGRLRDFLNSAQGQNALVSLFRDIRAGVDAATPGVEALIAAIAGVVQALGDAGVLRAAGEAFSAIAQQVAPLIDMVGGLAGPFAALLDVVGALAPVLVPAAIALAGFWAAAKLMDGFDAIRGKVSGFTSALGNVRTAAGEGGAMGAIRTLGGALGAGGILGIALAGAGIALDIWATKNANAKQAAAEHKSKVDELAGSFDKVTGAASAATREIQAQELTSVKLKDGTTSLATALGQLGISTSDYVDATTGNVAKQQEIAEKLNAVTRAAIEQSPVWKNNAGEVQRWGVSLDDVVAAANGNVQAQDRLTDAAKRNAGGVLENEAANQMLVDRLLELGGTAGEVGSQFGAAIGTLNEAKTQFETTQEAVKNFATTLDTVKIGLSGLKDGAAPLPAMVEGFKQLGASATTAAQGAGEAAAKLGGVKAGGDAAAESMRQSRQAFVDAATGAGLTIEQANALANQIGLIPAAARTNFETNATGVSAELNTLKAQFDAVPGTKQVTVSMLSEQAQQQLRDLGLAVTTLPNGEVKVDVKDEAGRLKFDAFITTMNTASAAPKMDLDTSTAQQRADGMKSYVDGLVGMAKADADAAPGTAKADGLKSHIDGITALMKADADITPGTASGDALQGHINGLIGIMTADANNAPGTAKGDAMRAYIQGLIGIMTADANSQPGTAKGAALKAYIDRLVGIMNADARTAAAEAALNNTARNRTATIYVNTIATGAASPGNLRINNPTAGGGVFGYAGGGLAGRPRNLRRGGVLPGYEPGVDRIPAVLSRGESVLVPELTRMLGARRILAANREASGGRPATVVGRIASMMDGLIPPTRAGRSRAGRFDMTERIPAALVAGLRDVVTAPRAGVPSINVQGGDMGGVESLLRLLRGDMVAGSQYGPAMVEALGSIVTELRRRGSAAASTQAARAVSAGGAFG